MSALALVAHDRGVVVTGCDAGTGTGVVEDLVSRGIRVVQGHDPSHLEGARALVVSAAIPDGTPEVLYASEAGIPVISRKKALAEMVASGRVIAVAGTHGKTTTTVMVGEMLTAAGLAPTCIAGGRVGTWGGNSLLGGDDLFVVEADEFDQAFLELNPWMAVVTNIEPEHLECYGSEAALYRAFTTFLNRSSCSVINSEDVGIKRLRTDDLKLSIGFGLGLGDIRARDLEQATEGSCCTVELPDGQTVRLALGVPGTHNVRNALAAMGVAWHLGLPLDPVLAALGRFQGVARRFERLGRVKGIEFVDDYAHHPTEVRAAIEAARQAFPGSRLVVVFQPHLYSRTQREAGATGEALAGADLVVVMDVYPAREEPIPGVSGELVVAAARSAGSTVVYESSRDSVGERVRGMLEEGDVLLTLGAGDVTAVGRDLVEWLRAA